MVRGATNDYLLLQTNLKLGLSSPGPAVGRWSVLGRLPLSSQVPVLSIHPWL